MIKRAALVILVVLSFLFGVAVGIYKYPPYGSIKKLCDKYFSKPDAQPVSQTEKKNDYIFEMIDPLYRETDVNKLIDLKNENDIIEKRNRVIRYIWSGKGFPYSKMPENVENDINDDRYGDFINLKRIDKLTVSTDYGFLSIVYLFHPDKSNGKLILYHQGHNGDFILGENTIQYFLNKGFYVMAFSMPLLGMNNQPVLDFPLFGKVKMINHNFLIMLKSDNFSPVKFFMEPMAVCLNYVLKEYNFTQVYMTGISGGGWTTTLYSAIDTRISKSYPVAGTLPIYMRITRDWGDYEQYEPELYRIANYLELYILASYGDSRKQFQMLNKYDSCCFAGIKYQLYEKEVKSALSRLGNGAFDIFLDDSHKEHKISDIVLNVIADDIKGQ